MSSDIDLRFDYHAPDDERAELHADFRLVIKQLAEDIEALPDGPSREKALALTKLEEVMFWVNAHIARNVR